MKNSEANLSKICWPDGNLQRYVFDADLNSFILYFTDYEGVSWKVDFINVVSHFIYDPVYVSGARFMKKMV